MIPDTSYDGPLIALWGPEAECGALRVSDDEACWHGYFRSPRESVFPDELAAARDRFAP